MTAPHDEEPIGTPEGGPLSGMRYTHPAFGQISASRIQGHRTLYGSDFIHHNYVAVRIAHSELHRSLSRDWHHTRGEIVEVQFSEAQWATFVSSMNVGQGVPCTINHLGGQGVPGIPHRTEDEHFRHEVRETVAEAIIEIDAAIAAVREAAIPKNKQAAMLSRLEKAAQHLRSNLPFVADQFDNHVEKKVEKAKIEVNAYLTATVAAAGLEALRRPLLSDGRDDPKLIEHDR